MEALDLRKRDTKWTCFAGESKRNSIFLYTNVAYT